MAVFDEAGADIYSTGDIERPVFVRSSIKPLQALPLIETGAAAGRGLGSRELALACASHNGEAMHAAGVQAWLKGLGLGEEALCCGAEYSFGERAAGATAGEKPRRWHHNCSGKHVGVLTTCLHCREDIAGYQELEHPAQQRWLKVVQEMADYPIDAMPMGGDGCGMPAPALPLRSLASAYARMARGSGLAAKRREAARQLRRAMVEHPLLAAGTGRCCSRLLDLAGGAMVVKMGAEGVYIAMLPELGWGVALKIDDGAVRAAEVALLAVLERLGALDHIGDREALAALSSPPILNSRGIPVGYLAAADR